MNRRNFLNWFSGGLAYLGRTVFPSIPYLAFAQDEQPKTDVLVVIFQRGGMDGLNAVVPYAEGSNYYDRRPSIAIPEPGSANGAALDLDGKFGLHPALAALQEIYQEGDLGIIHATGSIDSSRSHFNAMNFMERGIPGNKIISTGWINRHLQSMDSSNNSPFRAIGMGSMVQASLQGSVSALALQSISDFHLSARSEQLPIFQRTLAQLYNAPKPKTLLEHNAKITLKTLNYLQRLADTSYTPSGNAEYPNTNYGHGLRQVAQLIKEDVGLEVACIDIGGWDTHSDQGGSNGRFSNSLAELGNGLGAFYTDLQEQMKRVTVVTMSEFGRRVTENASAGTDHGHGNVMFTLGGGIKGGVYSRWPGLASDALDRGDLAVTTDYRDVLSEILEKRLANNSLDEIFPAYKAEYLNFVKARA